MGTDGSKDKRYYLDRVLNEEGWSIITSLLALPLLIALLFTCVELWGISTIHQNAESLKYYTLSKMEVHGGLPETDRRALEKKLADAGADPKTISITGDILKGKRSAVSWPNEVNIRIEFRPRHFNGFIARTIIGGNPGEPIKMGVSGSAVSQKRRR